MRPILFFLVANLAVFRMTDAGRSNVASTSRARANVFNTEQIKAVADGPMDKKHFDQALDRIMIPRVPGTPSHLLVHDYIMETFQNLGWSIEEDAFMANTPKGAKPFRNIVATVNPQACKRLLLACHYDSKYFERGTFVAATDSAVPCAMMISIAKVLDAALKDKAIKEPMSTSIQMIFFDGEEAWENWSATDSLYGSRHLADKWNKTPISETGCKSPDMISELDRIETFVLLDLLGTQNPRFQSYFPDTETYYARLMNIEQTLSSQSLLKGISGSRNYFQNRRAFSYIEDDHVPFFQRGVKILHIIPSPFPSVWHKLSDNASALHHPTISDLLKIFKTFVAEYLNLNIQLI